MNKEQILIDALEKIINQSEDIGREGCTYGDTDFDSLSVVYGSNQQLSYDKNIATTALQQYKELSVESGWISVEEKPKKNGTYEIWDNGLEIALFYNGKWKSISKEEIGQLSDFRKTLNPSHYRLPPNPPKQ